MSTQKDEKKHLGKVLLVGDTQTGKTSLARRFVDNNFFAARPTIGMDFYSKNIDISISKVEKVTTTLQIWDIAGSSKEPQGLGDPFYRDTRAAVIVLRPDTDRGATILDLDAIHGYCKKVKKLAPAALIYVIINKSDLFKGNKKNLIEEIRRQLGDYTIPVLFCSAKDDIGVTPLFNTIAADVYDSQAVTQEQATTEGTAKVSRYSSYPPELRNDGFAAFVSFVIGSVTDFAGFVLDHKIWASGNLLLAVAAIITLIALAALPIGGLSILTGLTVLGVAAIATGGAFVVWNALCLIGNLIKGNDGDESDNLADNNPARKKTSWMDVGDEGEQSFELDGDESSDENKDEDEDEDENENNTKLEKTYSKSLYSQPSKADPNPSRQPDPTDNPPSDEHTPGKKQ